MPFRSKRQQRAAFAGMIPGFDKERAHEWADETDFSHLPERAPAEKGKPTLRSKKASMATSASYVAKRVREQLIEEGKKRAITDSYPHRSKRSFVEFCAKLAFALPKPGGAMASKHVGSFAGQATANFLKAPGSTTAAVTNPRLSLRNAMTKTMRS